MFTKTLLTSTALLGIAIASPVSAASLAPNASTSVAGTATSTAIACVGKAVAARESVFDAGEVAYQTAETSAYSTRAKSLASAYATGTSAGVVAGIKTAWATFDTSTKNASAAWSAKRLAAWASFKTAAAACKAPAGVVDSAK